MKTDKRGFINKNKFSLREKAHVFSSEKNTVILVLTKMFLKNREKASEEQTPENSLKILKI